MHDVFNRNHSETLSKSCLWKYIFFLNEYLKINVDYKKKHNKEEKGKEK